MITVTKLQPFFVFTNFFLTFLYKMFRERYYESFSVRVEIIAYNAIIIFCHLIEFAIFAVRDFFSLFSIAVFNIPISHKIIVLLFLLQSYCFFSYFQTFFNFFSLLACRSPDNHKFCFYALPVSLPFPVVVCSVSVLVLVLVLVLVVVLVVCRSWSCVLFPSIIHAYTYTRARGFLDDNF